MKMPNLQNYEDDEITDDLWMKNISKNESVDFLKDPEEDIYNLTDGEPFFGIKKLQRKKLSN